RPERPYDEEGDPSNVEGSSWVTFDDCVNTVEDEVTTISIQIEDNITSEGNVQTNQNDKFNDFVVSSNVKYGLEKYFYYAKLSSSNLYFPTSLNKTSKPKTFHEASQNPKWIEDMNLEMEALHINNTYELDVLRHERKAIGCKWIWKIKYKSFGEVDRYKARLVVKGYCQREGIAYD
ncbi:putative RNA-directed DNA polymerase, partial [Tanacetum coccineum]